LLHRVNLKNYLGVNCVTCDGKPIYMVAQKSKPLPNDQKIVLNRIKACQ